MKNDYIYSLIIPARNEEKTIGKVVEMSKPYVDEILVVNDGTDNTGKVAKKAGAEVIENGSRLHQERSIEKGIKRSKGNIIITLDADLEHDPRDIPKFKEKLILENLDIIVGKRSFIPRQGFIDIGKIFYKKFGISNPTCGFKMFRKKVYNDIGFFHMNDYMGLDFLYIALERFRYGEVELTEMKVRRDPRIGSNSEVNKLLEEIIKYFEEKIKN